VYPTDQKARFPASVYGVGAEPDPRFTMANERTFLAWVRTSLALLAVAVGLMSLALPMASPLRYASAFVFAGGSLLATLAGWTTWARNESALRQDAALPGMAGGAALAAVVSIGLLLVGLGLALGR